MALHVGLRRERPLAGIIGYSGMLFAAERLPTEIRSRPPVLLGHGTADDVVPFRWLGDAEAALRASAVPVGTHGSQGIGHMADDDGLAAGGGFARRVLVEPCLMKGSER